jgi:hypothetical protein
MKKPIQNECPLFAVEVLQIKGIVYLKTLRGSAMGFA